jgi:hypothetical protein
MKKVFLFVLLLFSFSVSAQQLSIKDLIFLLNCNLEQADSLLSAKKYTYYKLKKDTTSETTWANNITRFINEKYQDDIKASYFLSKGSNILENNENKYIIYYLNSGTAKIDEENLRKECKKSGFVYKESKIDICIIFLQIKIII